MLMAMFAVPSISMTIYSQIYCYFFNSDVDSQIIPNIPIHVNIMQ